MRAPSVVLRHCVLAVALAGVLSAVGAAVGAGPDAPAGAPVIGVNAELAHHDEARLDDVAGRLRRAGIRYVRQPFRWAEIEPHRGQYDWSALDTVVDVLARHEIRLLATLETSPAWARHDPDPDPDLWLCDDPEATGPALTHAAPPTDPDDLAEFAARVAGRYGEGLWAVEVWSEPNLLPNWRLTGPGPEDYARLLAPTARALRRAAPGLLVVSAGLAPTTDLGVCYLSDVVFLDRLARTGVLGEVDAVGIEPFGLRRGPYDRRADREVLDFSRAEVLHDVLSRQGIDKPLWAVAWGWNALPGDWSGPDSPWGTHDPETAARWTGEGWARARAEWPWMGSMFVWHLQPSAPADDPVWGFALLDPSGGPTLLWPEVEAIAAGQRTNVPPAAMESGRGLLWSALLVAGSICLGLALLFRQGVQAALAPVLAPFERLSPLASAALFALALMADAVAPWPTGLVVLPLLVLLGAAHPLVALAGVAGSTPFFYGVDLYVGPRAFDAIEVVMLVAVAGRLLAAYVAMGDRDLAGGVLPLALRLRAQFTMWDALVVVVVAWAGLSPLWAEHTAPALREWRTVMLEPAMFYALLRTARDRRAGAQAAIDGLVVGGVFASLWALVGLALHASGNAGAAVAAEGVVRATGPYASPNNLALLLGRLVPVVVAFGLWGRGRRRLLCRLAVLPIGLALFATFSRGALMVGLPVTALYLGLVASQGQRGLRQLRRALAATAAAAATIGVLLLPFARTARVLRTFDLRPGSTLFIRMRLWESAVAIVRDHPWRGVGLDNFLYLYSDRYVQRDAVEERFLSHPHNLVLDWWTRLGIVGLGLFAALVVGNLHLGRRALRSPPGDWVLAVAALGMQVYALAHGLVDNVFFLMDLAVVWWIGQAVLLGLASGKGRM